MNQLPSGQPAKKKGSPWYQITGAMILFTWPLWGPALFIAALLNPNEHWDGYYTNQTVPWWGLLGIAPIVVGIGLLLLRAWAKMICAFTPGLISRTLFALLTLLLACSGIGFLVDIYLYFYVMAGQPRLLTGEPLANPQRQKWLDERRPTQTINIDARQVHIHG